VHFFSSKKWKKLQRKVPLKELISEDKMDTLQRFSVCFSRSKSSMVPTTNNTQVRKLMRQDRFLKPKNGYQHVQQQDQEREDCPKIRKVVSWASSTVDNESKPKKSFHNDEYYFAQTFEVNGQTYLGITPGSMKMKLIRRN
jgi:hypothetical protein